MECPHYSSVGAALRAGFELVEVGSYGPHSEYYGEPLATVCKTVRRDDGRLAKVLALADVSAEDFETYF